MVTDMSSFSIRPAGTVTNPSCHCTGSGQTQVLLLQALQQEDEQLPPPLVVLRLACRQQQLRVATATPPAPVLQEASVQSSARTWKA
jgi:hypothetical protein